MSTNNSKKTRKQEMLKGLKSEDLSTLVKTLEKVEKNGDADLISPIIQLGSKRQEEEVQTIIRRILFGIKISAAHPIMLQELKTMESNPFRRVLLSSIWEAGINGLEELDTIVRIAIEGDLYEAIECLTIIEESEGTLNEEKILDSLLLLEAFKSSNEKVDPSKEVIMSSIYDKVSDMNKGIL